MPVTKRTPLPVARAVKKIMNHTRHWGIEKVSITECDHRILAEDLTATHDVPPFNRSPYDGFAIRSDDTKHASMDHPITLNVVETIGAGQVAVCEVKSGMAVRIMTGAKIPDGADAVIMLELVKELVANNKKQIQIKRSVQKDENISFRGEDTREGTVLVKAGTKITPGIVAILATFGYHTVSVYKRPVVGILSTGTELLEVNEELQPGKIRNSNAYMCAAQVKAMGAEVKLYQHREDNFDSLYKSIKAALNEIDVLITTGGVSVGDYDFLPEVYKKLGADVLFNKIAMRPGSVTTVAVFEDKWLFGLSGNPSACFVGAELFVRPVILKGMNMLKPHCKVTKATLSSDFTKPNPFTRFVRAVITEVNGANIVTPAGLDKSSSVSSLAEANCLIVLPGGTRGWEKGSEVGVITWLGEGSEWPWDHPLFSKSSAIRTVEKQL
ncbi:molybdopterin molybdotransferase MoeA [Fictibacillus nanhaiensis]|uniref:molybdopterin molybdotransferase MoeA n=1 Tax=Fictibacillus nanhaiensis TaxID=742169 RepID=UPI002E214C9A|nr:gephyrin-like molybdotransferase Glp [Fictibacillus nanhaiensis]MED1862858.1 molybdopterin molybdotransferase MoeA [Fictibacillus nanhaiensis]